MVMGLEYLLGVIVSFLIMGYLVYALLYPEKF
jgi:K+-transporting ATPase KdpF subunit